MKDRIRLRGVTVDTTVGVNDWERRVRQRLLVDVEMPTDAARGAASDDLADALDYGAVAEHLRSVAADAEDLLVERLAERLASAVLDTFRLPSIVLTLRKPGAVPGAEPVELTIERTRG